MEKREIQELIQRYEAGLCTPEEKRWLERTFLQLPKLPHTSHTQEQYQSWKAEAWRNLQKRVGLSSGTTRPLRRWIPYAAAVILFFAAGLWYWSIDLKEPDQLLTATEVLPGGNRATLRLQDGSVIDLNTSKDGIVVSSDGIVYNDGTNLKTNSVAGLAVDLKMELVTPLGGSYQLTLSDGTKVWLNAGSTLRYPAAFEGSERQVELEGEAYFAVAENPASPFRVLSGPQTIEVLGTEFNVSAYADGLGHQTTLVKGSVRLYTSDRAGSERSYLLEPGEQIQITSDGSVLKEKVDAEQFISWKDGYFKFEGDLERVLQQVSRWYNIEVEYEDASLKREEIIGLVFRDRPLSEVLKLLESTLGTRFKLSKTEKGRRLIVMK